MTKAQQMFAERDRRSLRDDEQIWRYVPLRTLFFYLNGLVFVPSVAKLRNTDPFEGEFYESVMWFNTAFHQVYGGRANEIDEWLYTNLCSPAERDYIDINRTVPNAGAEVLRRHYLDFIRKTRFAWCWFRSCRESASMWNTYGNQGVAIQSSVGRVKSLFEEGGFSMVYGGMIYVDALNGVARDFLPERDTKLLLHPYFLKRIEYESEQEVRFVTAAGDDCGKGGILLRNLKPQDWITAIRLWPGLTNNEAKAIQHTIELLYPGVDCSKSDLFSKTDGASEAFDTLWEEMGFSAGDSWPANTPAELQRL